MRFSLRTITSGACSSISFFSRLLRLITRRYRSFRSEVAKRPPSSGTSGRNSGGITGITSRIIHSGLLPDLRNDSTTRRRLANFSFFCCDGSVFIFSRISSLSASTSTFLSSSLMPSAPIMAMNLPGNSWSSWRLRSSVMTSPWLSASTSPGIDDHVGFEIEHALEFAQRDIQQVADAAGQALEEPDVRAGAGQFDVAQALAADAGQRDFHAALVADHAAVLHALVLAAQALPILGGSEDARAEQPVALRLEGPVIDGLRLGDFAVGPAPDLFRRRQRNADGIEIRDQIRSIVRRGSQN